MIMRLRRFNAAVCFSAWLFEENRSGDVFFLARTAVALANIRGLTSLKTRKILFGEEGLFVGAAEVVPMA